MERVKLRIKGRVQGVFFRASTKQTADVLGIKGWVKNMPDGTVETLAEGESKELEKFIEWCKNGPANANVTGIDINNDIATGEFDNFKIVYE